MAESRKAAKEAETEDAVPERADSYETGNLRSEPRSNDAGVVNWFRGNPRETR